MSHKIVADVQTESTVLKTIDISVWQNYCCWAQRILIMGIKEENVMSVWLKDGKCSVWLKIERKKKIFEWQSTHNDEKHNLSQVSKVNKIFGIIRRSFKYLDLN